MKVLITGAAGAIGSNLIRGFGDRHEIRGLDLERSELLEDCLEGSIGDMDLMMRATDGMDAVIHLANVAGGEWQDGCDNIAATYNVFEAARTNDVRRIAYASRAGVLARAHYGTSRRTADMITTPGDFYTISKVFGESIGYMYSARHDMEVVAVRIGNFDRDRDQPTHPHHLSHGDCVRVFEQAIIHPGLKYEAVFAVSDSDWPLYDLDHGREVIGYYPQDKSHVPEEDRHW